jgi:hypothetical protein
MADLIFVVVILAFFAVAVLLVKACDRIIGPDPAPPDEPPDLDQPDQAVALASAGSALRS